MKTIWKYPLDICDLQQLSIPEGFEPLHIDVQADVPCLWCRVDSEQPKQPVILFTVGTGNPIPEAAGGHIGSYQVYSGKLVFHVFLESGPGGDPYTTNAMKTKKALPHLDRTRTSVNGQA